MISFSKKDHKWNKVNETEKQRVDISLKGLFFPRTIQSLQEAPFPHCVWQFEDWLHHPGFLFANDGGNFQLCPPWLITLQNCTPLQARGLQIVLKLATNCNNSTAARCLDKLWVMGHSWSRKKSAMGDSKNCLDNSVVLCNLTLQIVHLLNDMNVVTPAWGSSLGKSSQIVNPLQRLASFSSAPVTWHLSANWSSDPYSTEASQTDRN